ncbi:gene transfer agent portal protein [Vibrio phage 1.215.B._10N.222.54.F7]|nr:gene transfer agent portal protein [Vibrio phage 1.215.A._10N.222.54.F7]AUR96035.1 gene transfer agent portal protein [Vibrio phage 1.215.B._10N.222.54.F7]
MADKTENNEANLNARLITGESFDVFDGLVSVDYAAKEEKADTRQKQEGITVSVQAAGGGTGSVIVPRFSPVALSLFAEDSPSLAPCISAMEINIDGTGFDIVPSDKMITEDASGKPIEYADDPLYKSLVDLFTNPYPGQTMITIRKNLRRDLEHTGNGYLEFLLNNENEILFFKYLDARYTRLMEYTDQDKTEVNVPVIRNGREFDARLSRNERRYLYQKGSTARYLKELGATRDLNAKTGVWSTKGSRIKLANRASAVIHFTVDKDHNNEYGLPRWISQVRSMSGEVQAENLNLNYFNNGGIPPVIVFLQNGTLDRDSKRALNSALQGSADSKNRGVVVETQSNGGSLDKAASVGIKVERFSSEQQKDSMFSGYTEGAYKQIKSAYRLPQIFLGRSEDYNYATAYASIVITEAQVFKPERDEFDDIINARVVAAITDQFEYKSKPLISVDMETQVSILALAKNSNAISNEELLRVGNSLSNLDLNWNGEESNPQLQQLATADLTPNSDPETSTSDAAPNPDDESVDTELKSEVGADHAALQLLATKFAHAIKNESENNPEEMAALQSELTALTPFESELVSVKLARELSPDSNNLDALAKLNEAANNMLLKGGNK